MRPTLFAALNDTRRSRSASRNQGSTPSRLLSVRSERGVSGAVSRCQAATLGPGATLPPGCDATIETRPGHVLVAFGVLNPALRFFAWDSAEGVRGFTICDQSKRIEDCWDR